MSTAIERAPEAFLAVSEVIDWNHPAVFAKGKELAADSSGMLELARRCFEWLRDHIQHSSDFRRDPVTCNASHVLAARTGYCYAKSHLLAALLRANGIPAGFCYQRLSIDDKGAPFSLHGFNAIRLPDFGWYRVDSRGNKPGVNAQFTPPVERLAFHVQFPEERDYPDVLPEPLAVVVTALRARSTWDGMLKNLPDWEAAELPVSADAISMRDRQ